MSALVYDLNVIEYSDDCNKLLTVELPTSKRTIELRYQTPRLLDKIEQRKCKFQL